MSNSKIYPLEKDFSKWYTSVIEAAKLVNYSAIKGMMIYRPNGWAIWNSIKDELDKRFAKIGVKNVQLPMFIRMSDFSKESEHVEGFAPEVFMVTKRGGEELLDPYVIRPTSEILFCEYFKSILNSYRDLPIKVNQWCSVFRAEKTTRPFLRTAEFFWNELHTIHASELEAKNSAVECINLYKDFVEQFLCIPTLMGQKTEGERFAGANNTYTIETLMKDGQALQAGTSHYLGQNFAKSYDIKFTNKDNKLEYVYQTSVGLSTRIIGAIIMSHADNDGLVLPFGVAPVQIALIPISFEKNEQVLNKINEINNDLSKQYRTTIDSSNNSFGFKVSNQEIIGTPICIIIGPKDLANNKATIIVRNSLEKFEIGINEISSKIKDIISKYQTELFNNAKKRLDSSIAEVSSYDELVSTINNKKIALAPWGGDPADEKALKNKTNGITPRCIKCEINDNRKCFFTNKPAKYLVYFARAY